MSQKTDKQDYSETFTRSLVKNFGRVKAREILNIMKDQTNVGDDTHVLIVNSLKRLDYKPVSTND